MEIDKLSKDLNKLNLLIKKVSTSKVLSSYDKVDLLQKALNQSELLSFNELSTQLNLLIKSEQANIDESLGQRREALLAESRNAGLSAKRFGDFDRIDIFKVSYRGKKVRLEIGSEPVAEFEESQGAKVLERILLERAKLDNSPFERERFFKLLQYSCFIGQRENKSGDQWVPIRTVYSNLSLLRNLDSASFMKTPSQKNFTPYTTAQFVFDLARFGRNGWSFENYVVRSQTPNMSTVAAKKTVTLPDLDIPDKLGSQLAILKIVKSD